MIGPCIPHQSNRRLSTHPTLPAKRIKFTIDPVAVKHGFELNGESSIAKFQPPAENFDLADLA